MNQSIARVTQPATNYFVRSIKLVSVTAIPLVIASIGSKPIGAQTSDGLDGADQIALKKEKIAGNASSSNSDCQDFLAKQVSGDTQVYKSCDRNSDSQNLSQYSSPKAAEPSQLAVRPTTYTYTAPEADNLPETAFTQPARTVSQSEEEFVRQMTESKTIASASRQDSASLLIESPVRQSVKNAEVASVSYTSSTFERALPISSPQAKNTNPVGDRYSYNTPPNPLLANSTPVSSSFITPIATGFPQYPVAQYAPTPPQSSPYTPAAPSTPATGFPQYPVAQYAPTPPQPSPYTPAAPSTPATGFPQYPVAQYAPTPPQSSPYTPAAPSTPATGFPQYPVAQYAPTPPQPLPYTPAAPSTPATGFPQYPVAQYAPTPPQPSPYTSAAPSTPARRATIPDRYNTVQNPLLANPTPPQPLPYTPVEPSTPTAESSQPIPTPQPTVAQSSPPATTDFQSSDLLERGTAIGSPMLQFQGASVLDSDDTSARGRVTAAYPVSSNVFIGGSLDLTDGNAFADSRSEGLQLNEMYVAASFESLPNLRFSVGQLDLTSYFDRNSFAKDGATHFFNPTFQSNPALSVSGLGSRLGALVNWSVTDNLEAKAATFSSSRSLSDFQLDAFAGEVGLRYGNAIIRGTYATGRDAGSGDGFEEVFLIGRDNGSFGVDSSDQEESYGINTEVFIPNLQLGLFGRYGWYNNLDLNEEAETYSFGFNFLDLITPTDRLGLAYGRRLSNNSLRAESDNDSPDVLEAFYDFRFLSNLRLGLSVQALDGFSDALVGVRVKTEFDGFAF